MNFIFCIDNITRSTLWRKAAANTKETFCIIALKKPVASQNEHTLTHTHHQLNIRQRLGRNHPPQRIQKICETLTPILEVRTPISWSYLGGKKCAVVKWNLLQPIRHYIVTLSGNFPEDPISRSTQWHIDWTTHDNHRLDSRWAIQWPSRKWAYPTLGKGKSSLPS